MQTYLNFAQILVAVMVIGIIIMQVKGQGSGFFGSAEASFRSRRGIEKTIFQFTIGMVVLFILLSILSALNVSRPNLFN